MKQADFLSTRKGWRNSRPGHQARASGSLSGPRECMTSVLSSYSVIYPEPATSIMLVTPTPLAKQTDFPQHWEDVPANSSPPEENLR